MLNRIARLRKGEHGFTLIELLVVVAIIALLVTFALPKIINAVSDAKKAPGQADMQTISSALDRYYFANEAFPTATTEAAFKTATTEYLRKRDVFVNGYKKGFGYITDTNGTYYILVDPVNAAAASTVTVTCGSHSAAITVGTTGLVFANASPANSITAADVKGGCTVSPTTAFIVTN